MQHGKVLCKKNIHSTENFSRTLMRLKYTQLKIMINIFFPSKIFYLNSMFTSHMVSDYTFFGANIKNSSIAQMKNNQFKPQLYFDKEFNKS